MRALELGGLDRASAEDVAQEAFARAFGRWPRVRRGSNPPGYVYTTAFRLSRRQLRRLPPVSPDAALTVDLGESAAIRLTAESALSSMPPRRRAVAVACLVVGLSTPEAARALGIADGTVRKQLEAARRTLREALGEGVREQS